MDTMHHKILAMACQANVIINENEGSRLTIERVDWDEQTIHVVDAMDEYTLHPSEIDLEHDRFFRLEPLDPANF